MQNVYPSEALQLFEYHMMHLAIPHFLACRELHEQFKDRNVQERDYQVAWVYQKWDGPCEGELPLTETVGHINEVDQDKEQEEDRHIVHDDVDVQGDELQPVDQSEGTQNRRDVGDDSWRAPDFS